MDCFLNEKGVKPELAVRKTRPNEFVHCSKICKYIIGSRFCIVLLTEARSKDNGALKPNPNVYFEFGIMSTASKKIIYNCYFMTLLHQMIH